MLIVTMAVLIDFSDPSWRLRVPPHGWSQNSQGRKILWLPVLRLVQDAQTLRHEKGIPGILTHTEYAEIRAFRQSAEHFAIALRELARCLRIGADPHFDSEDVTKINEVRETCELIPLYVDLSFVYARRLADHFARAIRFVLFKNAVESME